MDLSSQLELQQALSSIQLRVHSSELKVAGQEGCQLGRCRTGRIKIDKINVKNLRINLTKSKNPFMVVNRLLWVSRTPLGTPVDPEVYIRMARSSFVGGTLAKSTKIISLIHNLGLKDKKNDLML